MTDTSVDNTAANAYTAGHATQLRFDPDEATRTLAAADPTLARLMTRVGAFAPQTVAAPDAFHALLRAIVYQQLSGKAAATIHRRLLDALGGGATPGATRIAAADDATLRGAGLSQNKMLSLQALAAAQINGELPDESALDDSHDAELIERYSAIRGIGRWTVEMLLLFHLGRPDVMPIHDLGVRKGYARTYGHDELPKPKQLERECEIWRPYRSVGSWYMWRATEIDDLR
jgi:3-methyladenine DNA glycosylase/8-oxoguanine DNA glycosylase